VSPRLPLRVALAAAALLLAACSSSIAGVHPAAATELLPTHVAAQRPPLPLRPDGHGVAQPTPPELVDRTLPTRDVLPPPSDGEFASTISPVPDDVLARSTWKPECPVQPADLRYVTVVFRGFDGAAHTGELLVAAQVAEDVAGAFGEIFAAGFPIEEMRIVEAAELTAAPTGDDNNTTAFVCRPAIGLTTWSAHALGRAVDVNPFQNPYRRGELVLPELATSYFDRSAERPGMIHDGGPVIAAFERIGWSWGGRWHTPVDLHHFSETGT
jgi:D-alanyl-D-alanine carboxypeptidase-like protein